MLKWKFFKFFSKHDNSVLVALLLGIFNKFADNNKFDDNNYVLNGKICNN